jgi:hypothetical protein
MLRGSRFLARKYINGCLTAIIIPQAEIKNTRIFFSKNPLTEQGTAGIINYVVGA